MKILSFGRSNRVKNRSNGFTVLPNSSTVLAHTATGDAPARPRVGRRGKRRLALKLRRSPRRSSPFSFTPLLLPARAQTEPSPCSAPSLAAPAKPRHPASFRRAPSRTASPFTSSTHQRARLSRFPAESSPPPLAAIAVPVEAPPLRRSPTSGPPPSKSSVQR